MTARSALGEIHSPVAKQQRDTYPHYKESGVDCLPNIPSCWNIKRLRYAVSYPAKAEVRGIPNDTAVSFVPMEAVGEYGGMNLEQIRPIGDVLNGYTYFADNDVVVAKITPCFENGKGALARGLENGIGFGTTELHVLRASKELLPQFLFYLTLGEHFRKLGTSEMYGAGGQKRVPERFLKDIRHPIPPLNEQRSIAAFLDCETAKIDSLIRKKELLIDLVHEKRAALINHVVTRGLNPNVPMKDSSVEWLGQIPRHWTLRRVKYLTRILRGKFTHRPRHDPAMYGGPYPFVQTGEINQLNRYVGEHHQTLSEAGFKQSKQFPKGTLVMTITGAGTANVAILNFEACFPDSIVGFVPSRDVSIEFLYNLFIAMRQPLLQTSVTNTQPNLNIDRIGALLAVRPPIEEQNAIVQKIDQASASFEGLNSKLAVGIIRLREYRTALISSAVAGQIDVRNYRSEATCR